MTLKPVPLIRHFTALPRRESYGAGDDDWLVWDRVSERKGWEALVSDRRAVILADAGAGKTFELMAQTDRMIAAGKAAFFIRIEDIGADFDKAFEIGDPTRFAEWLEGVGDAWFFLDSVDEGRLNAPRAFEEALRAFADRIRDATHRAHVYISSRPYAWNPGPDTALIEQLLPWADPAPAADDEEEAAPVRPGRLRRRAAKPSPAADDGPLRIYRLAPLDTGDIKSFAGHRGAPEVGKLLAAIERANLWNLAQRPFDLEDILATWRETRTLDNRLDVLQRGIRRQLSPAAMSLGGLPLEKALDGARRLAFSALMTGESNIRLPGSENCGVGLDACGLLPGWTEAEISALLKRGVFNDPIYGAVRFRHREIRELLAAEWLQVRLGSGARRSEVVDLIFRQQYGEQVIATRLRPVLPWLILFDDEIRQRALAVEPEIGVEGGDPARLPLEDRRSLLTDIVTRLADDGVGFSGGDNASIARIAHQDLDADTAALVDAWADNDDVIFFLGRLAWQGRMTTCIPKLATIALDPERGPYARIASARAVATSGEDARGRLWRDLIASSSPIPRQLAGELVNGAPADDETVALLLETIGRLEKPERYSVSGLTSALHDLIRRLPVNHDAAASQPLARLALGLNDILSREPFIEYRAFEMSKPDRWLLTPALHCVQRLVEARTAAALDSSSIALMLKATIREVWDQRASDDWKTSLPELVPQWMELNDALFWAAVDDQRRMAGPEGKAIRSDWDVTWMGHYWQFDKASFDRTLTWVTSRDHPDDRHVALGRAFRTYAEAGKPRPMIRRLKRAVETSPELQEVLTRLRRPGPAPGSMRRMRDMQRRFDRRHEARTAKEAADRAGFVAALKANPERVRRKPPGNAGTMTWDHYHLLRELEGDESLRMSRGGALDWRDLIPEFGEPVADAFREAATRQWRVYEPGVRSKGADTLSVPYELLFAMAGLSIEAGPDGKGLAGLTEDEAQRAARYAMWELNGFPAWFEPLAATHPGVVEDLVWQELKWELEHSPTEGSFHYILHDLVYHAPWLQSVVAPRLLTWLQSHDPARRDALPYCRQILVKAATPVTALAELASAKAGSASTPATHEAGWWALWVDSDPATAIPAVEAALDAMDNDPAQSFAQSFAVSLVGGRDEGGARVGGLIAPSDLKRVYILLHRYIRAADDLNRAGEGVYSPNQRDNAQDARNALFGRLADIPGEETWRALIALADEHPEPGYRGAMRRRARTRAVIDGDVQAWSQAEVAAFQSI